MYKSKKIIGVITARGGSKSIPKKNIKMLAGHPLIAYTIKATQKSKYLTRTIVSTDDKEIAEICRKYGADVPFSRPAEFAQDESTSMEVIQHALKWLKDETGEEYHYLMILQPTSPLRGPQDIDGCIKKAVDTNADSVMSMKELDDFAVKKLKIIKDDLILPWLDEEGKESSRRQDLGRVYKRNCAVYLTKCELIKKGDLFGKTSRPYVMPTDRSIDINGLDDFELAEFYIKKKIMSFKDPSTKKELDYHQWCLDNKINELFDIDLNDYGQVDKKREKSIHFSVDIENITPYPPELDDLTRLHFLVRSRKVTTILEFGVGKSTVVFADALRRNKADYEEFVKANLRRTNLFEIHSVDNNQEWIDKCKQDFSPELLTYAHFHCTAVEMTTFNGRVCTMYKQLPNICPDLIYLDGPDQFSVANDIRGISTALPDRLPMSADILFIEPFLLPGTLIIVDGRTANARFLKNNLQRNWQYYHHQEEDIHTFELIEPPLGRINAAQLRFSLGDNAAKDYKL